MNRTWSRSGVAALALTGLIVAGVPGGVRAQVAGSATVVGVGVEELTMVEVGWSAKTKILGKAVYNDKNERYGRSTI
jgi:hypothetical protein